MQTEVEITEYCRSAGLQKFLKVRTSPQNPRHQLGDMKQVW